MKRILAAILIFYFSCNVAFAQQQNTLTEERFDAVVLENGKRVEISSENRKGEILEIGQAFDSLNSPNFKTGDQVKISIFENPDGSQQVLITDFIRTPAIYGLFALFIFTVLFVARKSGLGALIGMAVSFLVVFLFIIPSITQGQNPVWVTLFGVLFMLPVTFYLSHGFNRKTTIALVSTFISVCFTALLALFFINFGKISGYANEQAGFVQVSRGGTFDIQGLLFAGIVVSVLGILDDVTVSQSSIVKQLIIESPKTKILGLYSKAMNVGKDHIGSVVNTLVLVYTGASLPLLVLFTDSKLSFADALNYEIVAEEIIKTLVASIGLIVSIPLTTIMAAVFLRHEYGNK